MAAFKESGAIEYGSDVLIGIQLYGVGYKAGEKQTAHADRVRELVNKAEKDPQVEIEVKVLKNRNGGRGGSGRLRFDKKYNFFSEIPDGFTYTDDPMPFDEEAGKEGEQKTFWL
jgi:replicative DNA helicase